MPVQQWIPFKMTNIMVKLGFRFYLIVDWCIALLLWLPGNSMLLRVLPSVYPLQPEPIHRHIRELAAAMPELDQANRQHLLRLLQMISEQNPQVSADLISLNHISAGQFQDRWGGIVQARINTVISESVVSTCCSQTPGMLWKVAMASEASPHTHLANLHLRSPQDWPWTFK